MTVYEVIKMLTEYPADAPIHVKVKGTNHLKFDVEYVGTEFRFGGDVEIIVSE